MRGSTKAVAWLAIGITAWASAPAAQTNSEVLAGLHAPDGLRVTVFAEGLPGIRFMALGPDDQIYATIMGKGQVVRLLDRDANGRCDKVEVVASGLDLPHGIAFFGGALWVAETGRVIKYPGFRADQPLPKPVVVVPNLPKRGAHVTRSIEFNTAKREFYVSVGSSCNVCVEKDPRRAAVLRYNFDGSGEQIFARGMRNAVGLAMRPGSYELWATNNERDLLGDDVPPEEIVNILERGADYGWPYCYGNRIPNPEFDDAERCRETRLPAITDTAHSAPLGCVFYTGRNFPLEYVGDFFVAYHGSWNRSVPTGYKVVRVRVKDGKPVAIEPFLTGFRRDGKVFGRPVDVEVGRDGALYVSDDHGGRVFRVFSG
jgi:glucose/arabinose dehydrogenase